MMLKRGFHHSFIKGAVEAPLLMKNILHKAITLAKIGSINIGVNSHYSSNH